MKRLVPFLLFFHVLANLGSSAPLPKLKVSENQRFLVTEDGKPFFYLADTAWELFHRLNREQAVQYLDARAAQRFTAIQAVALAELDGVEDPNAYGDLPLIAKDPAQPAVSPGSDPKNPKQYDYWDHLEYVVDQANARGLYVALLPTWGRWLGVMEQDEMLVTAENAQAYGAFLGKRFGKKGIIWVLGGDRVAEGFEGVWRAMARGIAEGVSGKEDYSAVMMTFHPRGARTSSTNFHGDEWLDFNMHQTGHGFAADTRSWERITADYLRKPAKPVLDGEPLYEDHPLAFRAKEFGYSFDAHIRQRAYWSVFSGAFGHTYGNHAVWQMAMPGKVPVNGPLFDWEDAIHRPGAAQMQYLRNLMESRPMLVRIPDEYMVVDTLQRADRLVATRGEDYAFVYSAQGRKFSLNLGKISGTELRAWWYNPRDGKAVEAGMIPNSGRKEIVCPSEGFGADWVLVLDDASKNYGPPGVLAPQKK